MVAATAAAPMVQRGRQTLLLLLLLLLLLSLCKQTRLTALFCGRAQTSGCQSIHHHNHSTQFPPIISRSNRCIYSKHITMQANSNNYSNLESEPRCARCREPFARYENMAQTGQREFWHLKCFVCAHCFKPFDKNLEYYERFGRKYCRQDFLTLFAPCCARCEQHIIQGKCIRAMNRSWHPECFQCDRCNVPLQHQDGFVKSVDSRTDRPVPRTQALCYGCAGQRLPLEGKPVCFKCRAFIDDEPPLIYQDEPYHAYHFNCHSCGIELRPNARLVNSDLYCQRCHDTKLDVPICDGCRKPIERQLYVTALGKRWHTEHFICAHCERPFNGKRYYELNGLAYCEMDCRQQRAQEMERMIRVK